MRFSDLTAFCGTLVLRAQARMAEHPVDRESVRRWLLQADPALVTVARVSEPAALLVLLGTGFTLPWLHGEWAPLPSVRGLHTLAGLALVLLWVYRLAAWTAVGMRGLVRAVRSPRRPRLPPLSVLLRGPWRRWRNIGIELAYHVTLAVMVISGVARAWQVRTGVTLPALLPSGAPQALHALAAPYFYAALLILFYVKGRQRARLVLQELRAP